MLKSIRIIIFILFCFLISTALAAHLSGKKVTMGSLLDVVDGQLSGAWENTKSPLPDDFELSIPTIELPKSSDNKLEMVCVSTSTTKVPSDQNKSMCKEGAEENGTLRLVNGVYTWTDKNGQQHFSGMHPNEFEVKE